MKYFGLTDKGTSRTENQDTFDIREVPSRGCVIIALCDGMGGQNSGNYASELARRSFVDVVLAKLTSRVRRNPDLKEVLEAACTEANSVVSQYSRFTEEYNGMGSTLVGCVVFPDGRTHIANVGDSRAYHVSPGDGKIRQITNDHSLVEMYVRAGILTREEARSHKNKNIITRAIGAEPSVSADFFELSLKKGELLLLCSDGVSNLLTDDEILSLAKRDRDPEALCNIIKDTVYERGAGDNLTVVVVAV